MKNQDETNESLQAKSFSRLIERGEYSEKSQHPPHAQQLFTRVMKPILERHSGQPAITVLDCGCGSGAWLDHLRTIRPENGDLSCYGFDVTPGMVEITRRRLAGSFPENHFKVGSILDDDAYRFEGAADGFDIIYTYDVVQQLPAAHQFECCNTMLSRLAPGGTMVVFDNDKNSLFGRKMAARKFATRYLKIPMVPEYFCNARYPPLSRFGKKISRKAQYDAFIEVSETGMKRALIVTQRPD